MTLTVVLSDFSNVGISLGEVAGTLVSFSWCSLRFGAQFFVIRVMQELAISLHKYLRSSYNECSQLGEAN